MTRRVVSIILPLAALLALSVPAQAAKSKVYRADGTVTQASLSSTGNPPATGTSTTAGIVTGKLGRGAITGKTTFGPAPKFTATFRAFFNRGSIKGTLSGTGSQNPDGSISFAGTGKFTGGTGRYKGARGSFSFTGRTQSATVTTSTFQVRGAVRY